jgi:outer membrane cobalamin receptor
MRMGQLAAYAIWAGSLGYSQTGSQNASGPTANASQPPPLKTSITVNATIAAETPSTVTLLNRDALRIVPGNNIDDRLRQVPGFSLFRRSSGIVANPTTQGVSLRGIGSSGASRTLVLWDSIPINDPFGGWVYWTRLDPAYIDRVEIERGAPTSIFGDRALSGSISIFSPAPAQHNLYVDYMGGNQGTQDVAAAYSQLWKRFGVTLHSRGFTTDGYYITPLSVRGTADTKANVRFATGDLHLDYFSGADRLSVHLDILAEERQNGTRLTHNSTGLGTIGGNYSHSWSNDQISVIAFHTQEQFHSTFSAVGANRNTETLASRQTVPSYDFGGAAYWQHHGAPGRFKWNSLIGADVDDIHGVSYDYSYTTRILTPGGGTLLQHGVFGQGDVTVGGVQFFAGIRHQFTGQSGYTFVSPNAGAVYGYKQLRFRASGYRSLRAPTLNELYRNFRVGNVLTLANRALIPEQLTGVEAGVDWIGERTRVSVGVFRNDLQNLITNVTLTTTPTQITRQRGNFASALSRGVEANVLRRWKNWTAEAGYLYADARISTGQRIPQVPKQQGTAQLTFNAGRTLISGGLRAYGLQFDDDLNQFKLPGFAALQLSAQQGLIGHLSAVAAVENLLDRSYLVALTPTPNTGSPRLWRIGLRWSGPVH